MGYLIILYNKILRNRSFKTTQSTSLSHVMEILQNHGWVTQPTRTTKRICCAPGKMLSSLLEGYCMSMSMHTIQLLRSCNAIMIRDGVLLTDQLFKSYSLQADCSFSFKKTKDLSLMRNERTKDTTCSSISS